MDLYNRMSLSKVRNKGMLRLIEIPNPSNCLLCEARLLVWNTPGTQSSSLKPKLAQLFLLELFFFGDVWWGVQLLHYLFDVVSSRWEVGFPNDPPLILSGIFFGRRRELHALRGKLRRACAESGIYWQLLGALLHQQGAEDPRFRQLCLGETYGIHPVSSTLLTKRVKKGWQCVGAHFHAERSLLGTRVE
jgi:hypothetical protein